MQIDFADTIPAPRNEHRIPRGKRVSVAGMSLLFYLACALVIAGYGVAVLLAFVFG